MRFVVAIVLFVGALVSIGIGLAQRTVWAPPDQITLTAESDSLAPVTVIDSDVLRSFDSRQTIDVVGDGPVAAAYGRTSDVMAWIGDARYNRIGIDEENQRLTSELEPGDDLQVPPLAGSDLWLNDYEAEDALKFIVNVPDDVSVIIASDGVAPAPAEVSITWPLDASTPFATPLIIAGSALLVLGLLALVWALLHLRRSRGPRRKQPRLPRPPRQGRFRPRTRAVAPETRGRRAVKSFIAVPAAVALGVGALAIAPASAMADSVSAPRADSEQRPVAVTEPQLRRIVARAGETIAQADEARDADLAATRLDGPALEFRKASYAIRGGDANLGALPKIPSGKVELTLPQQTDSWPRTVFTIVQDAEDETVAPTALVLIQQDARSAYKVHYAIALEPETQIPDVAPPSVGAARLPADSKLQVVAPADLAAAYGDVLAQGEASPSYGLFDVESDSLLPQIGVAKKNERKAAIPTTATLEFANAPGAGETVALATNDAGALVAVNVTESETVKPSEAGAAVNTENSVKVLSGKTQTIKGITATYGIQLLFFVPPVSEGGKVQLLGYSNALVSATELP